MAKINYKFFDVKAYLDSRGVVYKTSGKNIGHGWIGLECPFCHNTSTHFGVRLKNNTINCWACPVSGTVLKLIMKIDRIPYNRVEKVVAEFSGGKIPNVPEREKVDRSKIKKVLPLGSVPILPGKEPLQVIKYLKKRRFPLSLCQTYDLYWCEVGDYPLSIIAPVMYNNKVVAYQSVDVTGKRYLKYESSPDHKSKVPIKSCVYNLDVAKHQPQILIMEGLTDVWRIGPCGTGTFGQIITEEQIEVLQDNVPVDKPLKVVPDPDAIASGRKTFGMLSSVFENVKLVELQDGDPDDLNRYGVVKLLRL